MSVNIYTVMLKKMKAGISGYMLMSGMFDWYLSQLCVRLSDQKQFSLRMDCANVKHEDYLCEIPVALAIACI